MTSRRFTLPFCLVSLLLNPGSSDAQWVPTTGPRGGTIFTMITSQAKLYAGTESGIFRSSDQGTSWVALGTVGLSNRRIGALCVMDSTIFAGADGFENLFRSTTGGVNWTPVNLPPMVENVTAILSVHDSLGRRPTQLFAATGGRGIYRSDDRGAHWTPVDSGLVWAEGKAWSLVSIDTVVFAGTSVGVFRTSNEGARWDSAHSGMTSLVADNILVGLPRGVSSRPTLYAAGFGVHRSTDLGQTWTHISQGLPPGQGELPTVYIQAIAHAGGTLFAATYHHGIFALGAKDTIWQDVNSGLPDSSVADLAVCGGDLFAACGTRIWRRPLAEMVTAVRQGTTLGVPRQCVLEQNYPNPFNPSTKIQFRVPHRMQVTLTIVNTLGQRVANLFNEIAEAGDHHVVFNAGNFASGMYFCLLQSAGTVQAMKMVLSK